MNLQIFIMGICSSCTLKLPDEAETTSTRNHNFITDHYQMQGVVAGKGIN